MRFFRLGPEPVEVIESFGSAELVRDMQGSYELRGGTKRERQEALDWARKFMPQALPEITPSR